jgi:hypothetical protein
VEADCDHRFADRAFNLDDALYCAWIHIKQPLVFTTWTSHMHFMHSFFASRKRPVKRESVRLTID